MSVCDKYCTLLTINAGKIGNCIKLLHSKVGGNPQNSNFPFPTFFSEIIEPSVIDTIGVPPLLIRAL